MLLVASADFEDSRAPVLQAIDGLARKRWCFSPLSRANQDGIGAC